MASIGDLKDYSDINELSKGSLLLGNGFSIGVNPDFSYPSLFAEGVEKGYVGGVEEQLFEMFGTTDFEALMRRLHDAARVNEVLGIDSALPDERYDQLKTALIKTVQSVHSPWLDVSHDWMIGVAEELGSFGQVFTTNYDLLLYWVLGSVQFDKFTDLFYENATFSPINTDNWFNATEVYYLHGALFMFERPSNLAGTPIYKIRYRDGRNLLAQIETELTNGSLPLFVSEGDSSRKLAAILSNVYLSYAYRHFVENHRGLTIYGHSLAPQDDHIVRVLNTTARASDGHIAMSIYTGGKDDTELIDAMTGFESRLNHFRKRGGTLEFYRHESSPFAMAT